MKTKLYTTGDMHGENSRFSDILSALEKEELSPDTYNYLLVAGDFGFLMNNSFYERCQLAFMNDSLKKMNVKLLYTEGNHDHPYPSEFLLPNSSLSEYTEIEFLGSKVDKITDNIFHLKRGNIYRFEDGRTLLAMGGAFSEDKIFRLNNLAYPYFENELPSHSEIENAIENVKKHNNKVDIVLTHTCPRAAIKMMEKTLHRTPEEMDVKERELYALFDRLYEELDFKYWCFGHWHYAKSCPLEDQRMVPLFYNMFII